MTRNSFHSTRLGGEENFYSEKGPTITKPQFAVSPAIPILVASGSPILDVAPLLGTDQLVTRLRHLIPGGLSKRTIYAWLDLGCPHIELPGRRVKLAFVFDEVFAWIMSHRVEKRLLRSNGRGCA